MEAIVNLSESMPGRWYQLSTWMKHDGESKSKKFVFADEDEAVAAYKSVKVRVNKFNEHRPNVKTGCMLYVCIDGEIDLIESFRLFSNRLYDEMALATQ
jgi:hypothetical protein